VGIFQLAYSFYDGIYIRPTFLTQTSEKHEITYHNITGKKVNDFLVDVSRGEVRTISKKEYDKIEKEFVDGFSATSKYIKKLVSKK